jgi:hypothetical protein
MSEPVESPNLLLQLQSLEVGKNFKFDGWYPVGSVTETETSCRGEKEQRKEMNTLFAMLVIFGDLWFVFRVTGILRLVAAETAKERRPNIAVFPTRGQSRGRSDAGRLHQASSA